LAFREIEMMHLYQDLILKHAKNSLFESPVAGATHRVRGANPLCGDFITLELKIQAGLIAALGFQGEMSAITRASASLMCGLVSGLPLAQAELRVQAAFALLTGQDSPELDALIGEFAAMRILRNFPNRIKTATLPWAALKQALSGETGVQVSTENSL